MSPSLPVYCCPAASVHLHISLLLQVVGADKVDGQPACCNGAAALLQLLPAAANGWAGPALSTDTKQSQGSSARDTASASPMHDIASDVSAVSRSVDWSAAAAHTSLSEAALNAALPVRGGCALPGCIVQLTCGLTGGRCCWPWLLLCWRGDWFMCAVGSGTMGGRGSSNSCGSCTRNSLQCANSQCSDNALYENNLRV